MFLGDEKTYLQPFIPALNFFSDRETQDWETTLRGGISFSFSGEVTLRVSEIAKKSNSYLICLYLLAGVPVLRTEIIIGITYTLYT